MRFNQIFSMISIVFAVVCVVPFSVEASENERYKAIPASPGGPILIIDTKEGHLWTWNNNGVEETDAVGVNPRIRYQGNVRKNMKTPEKNALPSLSNESDRLINQKF